MARKTYTEEDRARVRQALLDTGLNMAVSKGLKGLHLAELAAAVGISKPYFYTFFDSLEDFSLQMMEEQRCRLLRLLEQELARPEGTWEEHVESFFRTILRHRENGILVMTQGEAMEGLVSSRCSSPAGAGSALKPSWKMGVDTSMRSSFSGLAAAPSSSPP